MNKYTGSIHIDLLEGEKLYQQRARQALPILVRQAKGGQPIYYTDLAVEMGIPNPRNLNHVLGYIGDALIDLADREGINPLPIINCLVLNKMDQLPGEGITWFIPEEQFHKQPKNKKKEILNVLLANIYTFSEWDWVLRKLGLEPLIGTTAKKLIKRGRKLGGESPEHLKFKNYISEHPELFGLPSGLKGKIEYELPSMDTVDVLFEHGKELVGVEVKSRISDIYDIMRGLFQCVKYKALIDAEQIIINSSPNSRVVLALETSLPAELISMKNQLGINVIELNQV